MSDGGKGSTQRLPEVPEKQVAANWNTIFGPSRFERFKQEQEKELKDGQDLGRGDLPKLLHIHSD